MCEWGWNGFRPFMGGGYGMIGYFISFIMLIIIIGVIFLVFKSIKNNNEAKKREYGKINNYDALKVLNEKFAKGEITEEEYLRKKKIIG
ncbi:SHOCT domain-containing protein [Marinitoga lauensis]|uniref:SHOCT domain-containing protein n=1 Tax=Marinitoga lauensis TaxID=2201189 RepID=UPI001011CB0C|nr:SHOCT domain-containing protein [Marinitoga lauensis]